METGSGCGFGRDLPDPTQTCIQSQSPSITRIQNMDPNRELTGSYQGMSTAVSGKSKRAVSHISSSRIDVPGGLTLRSRTSSAVRPARSNSLGVRYWILPAWLRLANAATAWHRRAWRQDRTRRDSPAAPRRARERRLQNACKTDRLSTPPADCGSVPHRHRSEPA